MGRDARLASANGVYGCDLGQRAYRGRCMGWRIGHAGIVRIKAVTAKPQGPAGQPCPLGHVEREAL